MPEELGCDAVVGVDEEAAGGEAVVELLLEDEPPPPQPATAKATVTSRAPAKGHFRCRALIMFVNLRVGMIVLPMRTPPSTDPFPSLRI